MKNLTFITWGLFFFWQGSALGKIEECTTNKTCSGPEYKCVQSYHHKTKWCCVKPCVANQCKEGHCIRGFCYNKPVEGIIECTSDRRCDHPEHRCVQGHHDNTKWWCLKSCEDNRQCDEGMECIKQFCRVKPEEC